MCGYFRLQHRLERRLQAGQLSSAARLLPCRGDQEPVLAPDGGCLAQVTTYTVVCELHTGTLEEWSAEQTSSRYLIPFTRTVQALVSATCDGCARLVCT